MNNISNLKSRKSELKVETMRNAKTKVKNKRRIAYLVFAIIVLIVFVGCNATDGQRQEAMDKTRTAMARPPLLHRRGGCTNRFALNYDQWATANDGSCEYPTEKVSVIPGCTDPLADNYDPAANWMNGKCKYPPAPAGETPGCTDINAVNFSSTATWNDGSCAFKLIPKVGCTDIYAINYTLGATIDDYSCEYAKIGCTDRNAANYNAEAKQDDGTCIYSTAAPVAGCTDSKATNFNSAATQDDGSCKYTQVDVPQGFPTNVPLGTYTMNCSSQYFNISQTFTNSNISQFAKELISVVQAIDVSSAFSGVGYAPDFSYSFTPWNGISFTMTMNISVSAQGINISIPAVCTITAK